VLVFIGNGAKIPFRHRQHRINSRAPVASADQSLPIGFLVAAFIADLAYGAAEDPAMPYGFTLTCLTLLMFALIGVLGELTFRHGIAVLRGVGGGEDLRNAHETPAGRPDIGKSRKRRRAPRAFVNRACAS
jgi:hypothetical protein